jgi:HicA-like toxin of HicAB toxin-antitoxin system
MNPRKLLRRLADGNLQNVSFADIRKLAEGFGFRLSRISGSHHIFIHANVSELPNLQEVHGEAKPYQIRQFLRLVERYDLKLEDDK